MNSDEIVNTKAFFDVGGELGLGMGSDLTEMVAGTIFETETKNTSEERDTDKDPRKISGEEGSSTPRIGECFVSLILWFLCLYIRFVLSCDHK